MGELSSNSGTLYDPDVVSACLGLMEGDHFRFNNPKGASVFVTTQMQSL
jgi:hypothetical protein